MSSAYVRTQIKNFIATNLPTENSVDLTNEFDTVGEMLVASGYHEYKDPWLGIQFIGSDELPVSISSTNLKGKFRETGSVFLHVVEPAKRTIATDNILTRGEALRSNLRGQRIGDIIVESVTPLNFEATSTLQFEGGFTSASVIVNYYRDLSL